MAKKNTTGSGTGAEAPTRRRNPARGSRSTTTPYEPGLETEVTSAAQPLAVAADMGTAPGADSAAGSGPRHEEIAELAYQRYLERGGKHGSDWDDWLAAERALRDRR